MRGIYDYPVKKVCIICGNDYFAYNRYQAARNKLCSRKCLGVLVGRANKNRIVTDIQRLKISQALKNTKLSANNPMWKGDKAGYFPIHKWVRRRLPEPPACSNCRVVKPPLDLANISGQYKRDLSDWEYLCRKCHMSKDGRLQNLVHSNRAKGRKII